jgi:NAD(P)-dependent dehydrogenase (short-subunit alcohol dehydrogenase family)
MSSKELEGKVAIVSGAHRGIGLETAKLMASRGAKVVMADISKDALGVAVKEIEAYGEVMGAFVDISVEGSVKDLMELTLDTFGRLDILDNNAAVTGSGDGTLLDMDMDVWDKTFAINSRGTMLMCKHGVAAMLHSGGGSIINISSGTSLAGQVYTTAYACSKGAINTLTKYVATQYGAQGIRCNALALGLVMTEALEEAMPEAFQQLYVENKLTGRLGRPADIAEMVSFLGSDRSAWITGQIYSVDGGFFAHGPQMANEVRMMAAAQAQES